MSSRASLIEIDGKPAGILAWTGSAYSFHAASKTFADLEGRSFAGCGDAELAARRLVRRRPVRRRPSLPPAVVGDRAEEARVLDPAPQ